MRKQADNYFHQTGDESGLDTPEDPETQDAEDIPVIRVKPDNSGEA